MCFYIAISQISCVFFMWVSKLTCIYVFNVTLFFRTGINVEKINKNKIINGDNIGTNINQTFFYILYVYRYVTYMNFKNKMNNSAHKHTQIYKCV